ncbi:MAG: 3-dehydroquinate synthase [Alphaproteobacteria bacterium]|nr:3-dehydroquinate synthase [Alphaproteobacteria bacterium]
MKTFDTFSYFNQQSVIVGGGLLDQLGSLIGPYLKSTRIVVIFDESLTPLLTETILPSLKKSSYDILSIPLKGNESIKNLETFIFLENELLPFIDRQTTLIAIGGGAIGDVVGFSASILLRGIPWIYLPTTLLSQVDSSIGGKTAINSAFGKNLIGSFHFPSLVVTDTAFLKTLSKKQIASGLVELTKHALIQDKNLFDALEQDYAKILTDMNLLPSYISKSIKLKVKIIGQDWFEKDQGTRQYLNLGHTFAHAFESITKNGNSLLHGEAVSLGLCAAYDLAVQQNICCAQDRDRVKNYLNSINMPTHYQGLLFSDRAQEFFKMDKKKKGEEMTFILPKGIGNGCHLFSISHANTQEIFSLFSVN